MAKRKLRGFDLFCGAGGSTTGAEQSGKVQVVLAVNHWHTAIQSHRANHPDVRHICAKIDDIDPRHDDLPGCDILMASPECTHHSNARGGRPMEDQKRATPWHVCAWAEAKRPKFLLIENVREFREWGPLNAYGRPLASRKGETYVAWLNALRALGYTVEDRVMNAADYGEATKRHRLFVVARRGPYAPAWPTPTHAGRWRGAHEIIDWSLPCPSIFSRKRPLADKTLLRILAGLEKFVGPFAVTLRATSGGPGTGGTARGLDVPLGAVTAGGSHHALAMPFQFKAMGRNPGATNPMDSPLPTIVAARENHAIVMPFTVMLSQSGSNGGRVSSLADPLGTITTAKGGERAVVAPFMVPNFGEREGQDPRTHDVSEPLPSVTSHGAGGVVQPFVIPPEGFYRGNLPRSIDDPLQTITSRGGGQLAMPFVVSYHGGEVDFERNYDPTQPLPTIDTNPRFGLAAPYMVDVNHGEGNRSRGGRVHSVEDPLGSVTSTRGKALAFPFLTEYYGTGGAASVDDPLHTQTSKDRFAMAACFPGPGHYEALRMTLKNRDPGSPGMMLIAAMERMGVADIGFRMLEVHELAAATGFPQGYLLFGTKAEQIKQVGNAVPPGFTKALCGALADAA